MRPVSQHDIFDSAPGSRVGTPAYLAPEVVQATRVNTYDGKKSDVWSCGVMLYIMLAGACVCHLLASPASHLLLLGCYPFERAEDRAQPGCNMQRTIQRIVSVDYIMPTSVSPEAQDLLRKLLVADPQSRLSVEEVLAHPWYTTGLPDGVLEMNNVTQEPIEVQVRLVACGGVLCFPCLFSLNRTCKPYSLPQQSRWMGPTGRCSMNCSLSGLSTVPRAWTIWVQ